MLCRKYVQRAGWPALSDWVQVRIGAAFRIRIHYYPDLGLQQAPGFGGGGKKVNKNNYFTQIMTKCFIFLTLAFALPAQS